MEKTSHTVGKLDGVAGETVICWCEFVFRADWIFITRLVEGGIKNAQ